MVGVCEENKNGNEPKQAECAEGGDGAEESHEGRSSDRLVGGLILRGCRCVLVRSLEAEWEGMRIPWIVAEPGESDRAAAVRAVVEAMEIEDEEVLALESLPPVTIAVPSVPPITVCALYAKNAPPPGPLENADTEDPEDNYDWYTFPRAMIALGKDEYARAALATMACSLNAGAAAGTVPDQWGGVFGQEWIDQAFKLLPGPNGGGLVLERPGCTIASIMARSSADAASSSGDAKRARPDDDEHAADSCKKACTSTNTCC